MLRSIPGILTALALSLPGSVLGDPGEDPEGPSRDERLFRSERPWWRKALEFPETGVDALFWPIKQGTLWAEDVNLPERILDLVYLNEERTAGLFPNFSFGGEIRSALGFRIFHNDLFGNEESVSLATLFSLNERLEEKRVVFQASDPHLFSDTWFARTRIFYQEDNDEDFFVRIGPTGQLFFGHDTNDRDDRTLALDTVRALFRFGRNLPAEGRIGMEIVPVFADVAEGDGTEPPIPRRIDGFGGPTVLLGGGPFLEWDTREPTPQSRSGWYLRLDAGAWADLRGRTANLQEYRYLRYGLDLQRYQPTFRFDRFLVLRAYLDRTETFGDGTVPFWDLPTLDEENGLRGFERNRFRERGAILFNAEYRYPAWETWDAFLFVDEGQVFRNFSGIELRRFEWSAGGGIQIFGSNGLLVNSHIATSDEAPVRFKLSLERTF